MITVRLYGLFRLKCKGSEFSLEASTLGGAIEELERETGADGLWDGFCFINGKPCSGRKMWKTPLAPGDVVALLAPASGG